MGSRRRVVIGRDLPDAGLDLLSDRFIVEAGGDSPEAGWLLTHAPAVLLPPHRVGDRDYQED